MKTGFAFPIAFVLLLLAILPWLFTGCQPGSLLPDELRQERIAYEETVDAARDATSEAMRMAQSTVVVEPLKTLSSLPNEESEEFGFPQSASNVSIFTVTPEVFPNATSDLYPVLPTQTSTAEPGTLATLTPTLNIESTSINMPSTPIGMVDVEDTLTDDLLTEQLQIDDSNNDLTDVHVSISPEGLSVTATLDLFAGIKQSIRAEGTFLVKNDNLALEISSITLGKNDVTQLYKKKVESRVIDSIYKLLPLRYVQSFILQDGQVLVTSKIRP
jgi:hypothetical protein